MNGLRSGPAIVLGAGALVAAIASCSSRPLPFRDDGASGRGGSGHAGNGGSMTGIGGGPGLELIGAPRLLLDTPTGPELHTTLLWTGEEYLFVWRLFRGDGVFMQRLDASGQTIGGNMRLLDYADAVDLAWGGGRLAAVWKLTNSPAGEGLFFQTFDHLARPLTAEVKLRSSASSSVGGSTLNGPRIAPFRDGFAIVWNEGQVLVATVTVDGHAQHGPEAAGGDDLLASPYLSLAARGDRIVVGWNGRPSGTPQPAIPTNMMVTRAFSDRLEALGSRVVLDPACLAGGTHQLLATDGGLLALWTREAGRDRAHRHRPARRRRRPDDDRHDGITGRRSLPGPGARRVERRPPGRALGQQHLERGDRPDARPLLAGRRCARPAGCAPHDGGGASRLPGGARRHRRLHLVGGDRRRRYEVYFQQARSVP